MDDSPITRHDRLGDVLGRWEFLALVSAFWLFIALNAVLYAYGMGVTLAGMTDKPFFAAWPYRLMQYLLLLPPLLGCYALSLRIGWRPLWRAVPLQLLLAIAFALLVRPSLMLSEWIIGYDHVASMPTSPTLRQAFGDETVSLWLATLADFLIKYGFGLALVTGYAYFRRSRDADLRVAALERQWTDARLAALRMQLSPHTLFNLLHTIRGQIAFDPRAAQAMVVQLADLLRRLLAAGERELVPLAEELRLVRGYLELQQQRFADRLRVVLPPDAALPDVWVPSLVLYPLAENAVVHGLAGHEGGVQVRIDIEADPEELRVRVANLRAYLAHAAGGAHSASVSGRPLN